jgi:hypothetical protein
MARKTRQTATRSIYSVHPGVAMMQKWIAELKEKSGRSLDEWLQFIAAEGPATEKERRDWLKQEHGLGTNTAWWLAERSLGKGGEDDDPESYLRTAEQYVEEMFAGPKAGLRPIYDELLNLGRQVGRDVRFCPCKTIVPFYRNHVFAQVKPVTRTRLDFGFALGDTKATGRLIDTGGFAKKDRITHRIPLASVADVDDEVAHWLQAAYDRDA